MRLALLLALSLAFGGAVLATAPTAVACTSDPDIVCHVIWTLDCAQGMKPLDALKQCV